jgi:HAD superfamily hydrolase (TIGR01509 family)
MAPALQESMLGRRVRDLTDAVAASAGCDPDHLFELREATFWRLVEEEGTLRPMPGARETVERLHAAGRGGRLRLALASSGHRRYVDHALETLGVRHAFELVVSGEDVTHSKPHPEIYQKTAAALAAPPATCLALEDSPHGVHSAAAAGLRVVAIPAGPTLNGDFASAEAVFPDLPAAGDYLLELLTTRDSAVSREAGRPAR